jgi:hypothetical protein
MIRIRTPGAVRRALAAALVVWGAVSPAAVHAADALRGKALYANTNGAPISCGQSSCHGADPSAGRNKIARGANNGPLISSAIAANTGGMGFLGPYVNATDAADIGAYIAYPNVTAAPVAAVSPGALAYASTAVGTTSASSTVTVANTGAASLSLAGATLGGANAGDWVLPGGGTCAIPGTVAPGASCTIAIAFRPTAGGARAASLSIAHNAAGSPGTVSMSGTGSTVPQPSIALSAAALDFGAVIVGTPSAARTITVSNPGNATLTLGTIAPTGANAGDFARSGGTCAASVAAGASCTIDVVFTPAALGARAAALSIVSNAPAGTAGVPLAGTGQPAPVPGATLSPGSAVFGNATVNVAAPNRTIVLASDGTAPLAVGAPTLSPPNAGFSIASSTCPASLAPGATCTLSIAFRPTAPGAVSATLSVPTNAAGSPDTATLSGTGVNGPTAAPALSVGGTLSFDPTTVGARSAERSVSVENRGTAPTSLLAIALSGADRGDFRVAGTCAPGLVVPAGGACTLLVSMAPSTAGAKQALLAVGTDSGAQLELPLAGTGTAVVAVPSAAPAAGASVGDDVPSTPPVNLGAGGCTMLSTDTVDPLLPSLLLLAGLGLALRRRAARRDPFRTEPRRSPR